MSDIAKSVEYIRKHTSLTPKVMVVLGSGLGGLGDEIENATAIPFGDIPGFHASNVIGHKGLLVVGRINGVDVVAMQGRFHLYEGHSAQVAAFPIRVMAALGARTLVVSNAAGAVNFDFRPGDLMLIDDHINFMWGNPLTGKLLEGDVRFPDMSQPYDRELQQLALDVAKEQGLELKRGVYIAVLGPSYETPAEIAMFRKLGADAVGMSTIPEVIAARAMGVRVLGVSLITNAASGITGEPLTHEEVIQAGIEAGPRFTALAKGLISRL